VRLLVEQMPAVLWSTDRELRFTSSLGGGLAGLGLKPNQIIGVSLSDYFARPARIPSSLPSPPTGGR
jgi:hypothetical protein